MTLPFYMTNRVIILLWKHRLVCGKAQDGKKLASLSIGLSVREVKGMV
jgi:hypothetical protein